MKIFFRFEVEGQTNVPKTGPVILASNHLSFLDSPLLIVAEKRTINFIGKDSYFRTDNWKHKFVNWLFRALHVFPVNREGGPAAGAAIDQAIQVLKQGKVFGIYPEGTRSPTGVLYRGHTGLARISLATGAPIVPVAMQGTPDAMPYTGGFHLKKIAAKFGKPIYMSEYSNRSDLHLAREITDRVMLELQKLSGQVYDSTTYGSVIRKALGKG
ncbi:MAG: 1-acyl-sn-glycerol-3-phosphate acyltransferase [Bifidobacteriaceae bacterium]|jgi:1-acyl-sn-glycerol-3-phosphate acyltransferase|nr:1-acyl-sn-glycerol-3-phosphate acyltransferase [Bifidobacteriaceae bacterium]